MYLICNIRSAIKSLLCNNYLFTFLLFVIWFSQVIPLHAQAPKWQWVKGGGGSAGNINRDETAKMMGIDRNSNIYMAFDMAEEDFTLDTFYRANYTLASFVCSYTCNGQLRWIKEIGKDGYGRIGGMTVDSNGNVYMFGATSWEVTTLASSTIIDTLVSIPFTPSPWEYLLKLDSNGNRVWLKFPGNISAPTDTSSTLMQGRSVLINEQGELVVLLQPTPQFDSNILWQGFHVVNEAPHVAKFDTATGHFISMVQLDLIGNLYQYSLQFTQYNNEYYICYATMEDSLIVGGNLIVAGLTIPNPTYQMIIARFNSNGTYRWHQAIGGYPWSFYNIYEYSNLVFRDGKMYSSGGTHSGVNVYGNLIYNELDTSQWNFFIVCKDTADLDHALWVSQVSQEQGWTNFTPNYLGLNKDNILIGAFNSLSILNNGDTLKAPGPNGGICIVSLSAITGIANWGAGVRYGMSSSFKYIESIVSDQHDNIFVGGTYRDSLYDSFGNAIFYNGGSKGDFFISKISYTDICQCNTGPLYPSLVSSVGKSITVNGFVPGTVDSLQWIWGDGTTSTYPIQNTNVSHTYTSSGNYTVCLRSYNACGSKDSCFQLNIVNGVIEQSLMNEIVVYPNPTSGVISIQCPFESGMSVAVYNLLGEQFYQHKFDHSTLTLNLNQLSAGMYLLEMEFPDGSKALRKIVKE